MFQVCNAKSVGYNIIFPKNTEVLFCPGEVRNLYCKMLQETLC